MLPGLCSYDEYIKFTDKNLQDVRIPKAHDDVLPKLKLLDLSHLNISADGSKLKAHSSPYGKKVCNCDSSFSNPCDCKRFYNSPDASWGYDHYREGSYLITNPKKNENLKCDFVKVCSPQPMVESSIPIPKIIPVCILPYPEYPQNGRIPTTTGLQSRGFSNGRRTTLSLLLSRPGQRSVFSFMLS